MERSSFHAFLWILSAVRYDGDLTVSLSGGLDITIPNHQLVIPSYRVNEEGRVFIENSSNREVLMNSLQDGNSNMLLLGRAFLTSAYLLVDNDHLEFTLWKSEPTQSEKLVPLGIPTCRRDSPLASSTAGSQNSSSETPLPHNEHSSGGLRPGAIAGIVLGAIFFVTGLLFGVLLFRQRRAKQSYAQKRQSTDIITGLEDSNDNKGLQEMPTDYHEPKEMPLTQHPPYDQTPYEMPAQSPPQELSTPGHGRQEVG